MSPVSASLGEDALLRRYEDAYRIARAQIRMGTIVKFLSYLIGAGAVACGGLILLTSMGGLENQLAARANFNAAAGAAVLGLLGFVFATFCTLVGLAAACILFVFGTLLSAQGQTLEAQLDCAVYASPFLTDNQKRTVLRVGERVALEAT